MTAPHLEPLYDRVVVRTIPDEEVSDGGIIIPQTATTAPVGRGRVLAVGPGMPLGAGDGARQMTVKVGDVVMFGRGTANGVQPVPWPGYRDGDVVILREPSILGIWRDLQPESRILAADGTPQAQA